MCFDRIDGGAHVEQFDDTSRQQFGNTCHWQF